MLKLLWLKYLNYANARTLDRVRAAVHALLQAQAATVPISLDNLVSDNQVEQLLAKGLSSYRHELDELRWWTRLRTAPNIYPDSGKYDWMEGQILYLFIRMLKPGVVVEVSPYYGYSSGFMLLAMNANKCGRLYSIDLEDKYRRTARKIFQRVGIDSSRQQFVTGDVRRVYEQVLPERVDLLFMDADHSYGFAQWYLKNLYPRVAEGGLMHVHDVLRYGVKTYIGEEGEGRAIWEFLQQQQIPEADYLYISEFLQMQPAKPDIFKCLERYPFNDLRIGNNGLEQNTSLWLVKKSRHPRD